MAGTVSDAPLLSDSEKSGWQHLHDLPDPGGRRAGGRRPLRPQHAEGLPHLAASRKTSAERWSAPQQRVWRPAAGVDARPTLRHGTPEGLPHEKLREWAAL